MTNKAIIISIKGIPETVIVRENSLDCIQEAYVRMCKDGKANLKDDMERTVITHGYYEYFNFDGKKVVLQLTETDQEDRTPTITTGNTMSHKRFQKDHPVKFYDTSKQEWIRGVIDSIDHNGRPAKAVVRVSDGTTHEALARNLRYAPTVHMVRIQIPRDQITKMDMDERELVLELDASSTYVHGFVHPFNVHSIEERERVVSHGLYVDQEGKMTLGRTE